MAAVPITVHLSPDELAFVDETAARETRQRSVQIRHFIREGMRRAANGHGQVSELVSWPPAAPQVRGDDLPAARRQLEAIEAEISQLAPREGSVGGDALDPQQQTRLGWLRNTRMMMREQIHVLERLRA